jgi:hypothetical protein
MADFIREFGSQDGPMCRTYRVNVDAVYSLARSLATAELITSSMRLATESLAAVDIESISVDWGTVAREKAYRTEGLVQEWFLEELPASGESAKRTLRGWIRRTNQARASFRDAVARARQRSLGNMERTVRLGEMGIEGLKFIRGTSADVFSICAGVLAGGPMTPTGRIVEAAVGATLDAAFQAADTYAEFRQADSALAGALVTGFGKFSVRAIPLRKAGRDGAFAIAGAVIFLEATTDFTVGLVEGNPVKDALKGAAIGQISGKVVGGALGSLMRERAMLDLIGRGVLRARRPPVRSPRERACAPATARFRRARKAVFRATGRFGRRCPGRTRVRRAR